MSGFASDGKSDAEKDSDITETLSNLQIDEKLDNQSVNKKIDVKTEGASTGDEGDAAARGICSCCGIPLEDERDEDSFGLNSRCNNCFWEESKVWDWEDYGNIDEYLRFVISPDYRPEEYLQRTAADFPHRVIDTDDDTPAADDAPAPAPDADDADDAAPGN